MVSFVFVSCELVIQVLQLISCSQNTILAFVKNAFYSRVLAREFTCYSVTLKCEKKFIFFNGKDFLWVSANHWDNFLKINCKFLCKFLPLKSRVPNSACLWSAKNSDLMYCHSKSKQNISTMIGSIQLLEFFDIYKDLHKNRFSGL